MAYELQLDQFQGPLELLYQLIKKNKIEISEISLARVTEQYLEYLNNLKDFNLDMASEFMVIAAELIEIKTRTLLPGENNEREEEDSNSLVNRLKEYHYFKKVSGLLQEYEENTSRMFTRPILEKFEPDKEFKLNLELELDELIAAYKKAMAAANLEDEQKEEAVERKWHKIDFENIRIEDKTEYIKEKLLKSPSGVSFIELIEDKRNRLEIIVTFLSILELAKIKQIKLKQEKIFANIQVI
jgi:segregation and condensation protein A